MTKIKHPTAATLKKWARMNNEYDHDAVRIEIAEWCQHNTSANIWTGDCLNVYKEIAARNRERGSLSIFDSFARYGADTTMLARVCAVDSDLADKIHNCL